LLKEKETTQPKRVAWRSLNFGQGTTTTGREREVQCPMVSGIWRTGRAIFMSHGVEALSLKLRGKERLIGGKGKKSVQ